MQVNLNKLRYNISKHNRFGQEQEREELEALYNFGASWAWFGLLRSRSCVITQYVAWRHRGRQLRRRLGLIMIRSWLVKEVYFEHFLASKMVINKYIQFFCCIFLQIWLCNSSELRYEIQQHSSYDLQSLTSVDDFSRKSCKFHNSKNNNKKVYHNILFAFSVLNSV